MRFPLLLAAALAAGSAAAQTHLYVQAGTGHQIGMTDRFRIEGADYEAVQRQDLPYWVADFQIGIARNGFFLQGQHVSSPATRKDHGFTVISAGYRWEFSF